MFLGMAPCLKSSALSEAYSSSRTMRCLAKISRMGRGRYSHTMLVGCLIPVLHLRPDLLQGPLQTLAIKDVKVFVRHRVGMIDAGDFLYSRKTALQICLSLRLARIRAVLQTHVCSTFRRM